MKTITIETIVNRKRSKVWEYWNQPKHIVHWNFASDDWCCPRAENDLRPGGKFSSRMEAKDGSMGFDFGGHFTLVESPAKLEYVLEDDRKVLVTFDDVGDGTQITETFEPESMNPLEMQEQGWNAILQNFKKYAEGKS
ncbi:SRPBCC family protein [Euzebyella saccharophila]|uniref:SRPBCC family protein n=1 Tax=Euzebyella saccharophila TaxID=679664 RepID=A0ABV8JSS5_9FLAO|nr:SRPBCC family protein [Euzebyella saccharophila]